jgi:hypothetical protein
VCECVCGRDRFVICPCDVSSIHRQPTLCSPLNCAKRKRGGDRDVKRNVRNASACFARASLLPISHTHSSIENANCTFTDTYTHATCSTCACTLTCVLPWPCGVHQHQHQHRLMSSVACRIDDLLCRGRFAPLSRPSLACGRACARSGM